MSGLVQVVVLPFVHPSGIGEPDTELLDIDRHTRAFMQCSKRLDLFFESSFFGRYALEFLYLIYSVTWFSISKVSIATRFQ